MTCVMVSCFINGNRDKKLDPSDQSECADPDSGWEYANCFFIFLFLLHKHLKYEKFSNPLKYSILITKC